MAFLVWLARNRIGASPKRYFPYSFDSLFIWLNSFGRYTSVLLTSSTLRLSSLLVYSVIVRYSSRYLSYCRFYNFSFFFALLLLFFFLPFFDPISVFVSVVFFIILISFFGSFMRMTLCDKPNEIDGASAERRKNQQQNVCWWFLLVILLLLLILFFIISALCTNSIDESFKRIAVLSRYTNFFFLACYSLFLRVLSRFFRLYPVVCAINGFYFTSIKRLHRNVVWWLCRWFYFRCCCCCCCCYNWCCFLNGVVAADVRIIICGTDRPLFSRFLI